MTSVVAVIAPGAMGGAVGKRLVDNGVTVLTSLEGRSEETRARAKAAGKHCGRPRVSDAVEKRIRELLKAKTGILATARKCGVGTSTVMRVKAALSLT